MANRESQGLQIALILFVMITVVLAVTTFVFYRKSEEARGTVAAAKAAEKTAREAFDLENFKVQYFMHILGAAPKTEEEMKLIVPSIQGDPQMAAIHTKYEGDMITYGEGLDDLQKNYGFLPANVLSAIQKLNSANVQLSLDIAMAQQQLKDRVDTETQRTSDATKATDDAKNELASERTTFNNDLSKVKNDQQTQFTSYQAAILQEKKNVSERDKMIAVRDSEIKNQGTTITLQKNRIVELLDEPFETPDGRIAWVNQATRTVWVNLGMADGLRRQTTFSVYEHDAMNVAPGAGAAKKKSEDDGDSKRMIDERKGKIEITRVLDQHLAEARIVEDWPDDPILPGDQVFSPAWKPGRKIRFGLVGFMDLDDDRRSDRDLVRSIISMGGGHIDAEVHDDGTREGELSANTRYLVRGTDPDGSNQKLLTAHSNILKEAEDLGVQEITLLMLLDLMGYQPEVRTVGLGKHADPMQFKAEAPEGRAPTSTGNVSDVFKERRPPKRSSTGSAY